jgi:hypothetical protein
VREQVYLTEDINPATSISVDIYLSVGMLLPIRCLMGRTTFSEKSIDRTAN